MVSAFNDFNSRLNSAIELKPAPVEVYHYIDRMPSLRAATATRSVENIRKLEIKHVSIRSGEQKILDNFSAEIPLGKKIQILGKNGSGKSSLIKSILGLLPYEGEILINDVDVETFSREGLLQKVSYHSQVPFLFPQTVIENIRLSNPKLSDSEIIKFCEEHALDRFIRNREQGFYAMVSEGGTNLSGGEKQSIALARSLLAESEILILDEYANHLDSETLKRVDSFLARIRNKTVLVISHQAASFCEVQIKMEKGRLVSITENLAPALTQET
jgi:ABC-type bacteriocin/lantibiotic exporter with double-glycine peptidase domain